MLGTVRVLISAGEDLLPELARSWLPGRRMFNAYGPTEATLWSTTRGLDPALLERVGATPLGDPIPGTQLRLLTEDLTEPTDGEPGELFLGGAGVAAGYLDDPELTDSRFPTLNVQRFFRTGDFAGRRDGSCSTPAGATSRSNSEACALSWAEVRHVLTQHALIHDAVIVRDPEHDRLVAYLVSRDQDVQLSQKELIDWMEERLPLPMVPSLYAYLPALPLTEWGKIDHSALPSPAEALASMRDPTPTSGGAAQGSDTQDKLTAIVAQILQLPDFGPDDDFFMLGMTSLTMARLLRTVSAELGVESAGSGPSEFVQWKDHLPDHTEIWPVQLPGREASHPRNPLRRPARAGR